MPIKESQVEITDYVEGFGIVPKKVYYKVYYTDELKETSVSSLAWDSASGGFLQYLFTGYFSDGKNFHQWYFSNARRHEEMREAIEGDLGREFEEYVYGQLWFNPLDLEIGKLLFDRLILHSDIPNQEQSLRLLFSVISPDDYECEDFTIMIASTRELVKLPVPREGVEPS